MDSLIHQLEAARTTVRRQMQDLISTAERENRTHFDATESRVFKELSSADQDLADQISDAKRRADIKAALPKFGPTTTASQSRAWAEKAAQTIRSRHGGEQRAVVSGSLDLPALVEPSVVDIPHPARLIDLFTNRTSTPSNSFTYYQQIARTNNATAVADLAQKPTSVLTVKAIEDRCRVIAHLSDPVPLRIWDDHSEFASWLQAEMVQGVLDGLEDQAINGSGSGENIEGLLSVAGTTTVADQGSLAKTLRAAVTELQNLGETPTGWALNPLDAERVDLERWGAEGGFLTGGYANDSGAPTSSNIFGQPIKRVVSPSVPSGTAILGDWSKLKLYVRQETRFQIDTAGENFTHNSFVARAEIRAGIAILRPQAFAICDLTA